MTFLSGQSQLEELTPEVNSIFSLRDLKSLLSQFLLLQSFSNLVLLLFPIHLPEVSTVILRSKCLFDFEVLIE